MTSFYWQFKTDETYKYSLMMVSSLWSGCTTPTLLQMAKRGGSLGHAPVHQPLRQWNYEWFISYEDNTSFIYLKIWNYWIVSFLPQFRIFFVNSLRNSFRCFVCVTVNGERISQTPSKSQYSTIHIRTQMNFYCQLSGAVWWQQNFGLYWLLSTKRVTHGPLLNLGTVLYIDITDGGKHCL